MWDILLRPFSSCSTSIEVEHNVWLGTRSIPLEGERSCGPLEFFCSRLGLLYNYFLFELLTTASNPIDLDLGTSALQIVISYSCLGIIHSTWDR
jgi:hypothetical protein